MIPIAKPLIGEEEIEGVVHAMRSGTIAEGPRVKEFEEAFARYIGVGHAVAVNSGTAALLVSLLAKGIGSGDEVITTPFTFIATANAVLFAGARPVFVDIDPVTYNIDPQDIRRKITGKTKAIIPVDLYGHMARMDEIMDIAGKHGLAVIEDACQAHGASLNGKMAGSFDIGCFSFYPTKNMTTGEGGMITTDDPELADRARMLRAHGSKVRYYHDTFGFNFRMMDINASIGLSQLKKIDQYNGLRIANAKHLSGLLSDVKGIVGPTVESGYKHVFHQYTVRVTKDSGMSRDDVAKRLTDAGIGTGVYYPVPIHLQKYYKDLGYAEAHPVAEEAAKEVISLPVHPSVTPEEIEYIAETLRGCCN